MFQQDPKKLLEEELRFEIFQRTDVIVPQDVLTELNRLYPGYELIFRGDCVVWVLYWVKRRGISPAGDLLSKQFVLPGPPGMWLIGMMQQLDRSGESFKEWQAKAKKYHEQLMRKKVKARLDFDRDMKNEVDMYLRRGKETLTIK